MAEIKESLRLSNFATTEEFNEYLVSVGLADYTEVMILHKINGKLAPFLTDQDLKDMGINIVGDRLRFREAIKNFTRKSRFEDRNKPVWIGEEKIFWSWIDQAFGTCCGLIPVDPSEYKLTQTTLKVKTNTVPSFGPIYCECFNSVKIDNIDLTYVKDVDLAVSPAPCFYQVCCCGSGKGTLYITYGEDELIRLFLDDSEDSEKVHEKILGQIEESQMMERD